MSRRRDRGFLGRNELRALSPGLPRVAATVFVTIACTFKQIDEIMLDELQADVERRMDSGDDSTHGRISASQSIHTPAHPDLESYVEKCRKDISDTTSEIDTFAYLKDRTCLRIWSQVHGVVIKYQGDSTAYHLAQWATAKSRAYEILNLALLALDNYRSDECQNLLSFGHEDVVAGIEAKLTTLLSFDSIHSRLRQNDEFHRGLPLHHEFKQSFEYFLRARRGDIKTKRKERYIETSKKVSHRAARLLYCYRYHELILIPLAKRDMILVTATVTAIAISAIPLGLALHNSTNNGPGSTSEADFWLLVQTTLMQFLSLVTTILTTLAPKPREQHILVWPKILTWTIAILGLGCALSAPLLYVRFLPMYSALISFMASAAQACMVLQLALFVDISEGGEKMD